MFLLWECAFVVEYRFSVHSFVSFFRFYGMHGCGSDLFANLFTMGVWSPKRNCWWCKFFSIFITSRCCWHRRNISVPGHAWAQYIQTRHVQLHEHRVFVFFYKCAVCMSADKWSRKKRRKCATFHHFAYLELCGVIHITMFSLFGSFFSGAGLNLWCVALRCVCLHTKRNSEFQY